MTVDSKGARDPIPYYSIAGVYAEAEALTDGPVNSATANAEALTEALRDSVRHHLVADVPVGAFLSAGIDSGALVGLMRDAGQNDIRTVTLSFAEFAGRPEDEAPLAARVARRYGTRHTDRIVSEDEFRQDLPKILAAMDQPSIDGINTWFVSKAARELGLKVAISGLGGDELFGGYPSFRDVPRMAALMAIPAAMPGWRARGEPLPALTAGRARQQIRSSPNWSNSAAPCPAPTTCGAACSCRRNSPACWMRIPSARAWPNSRHRRHRRCYAALPENRFRPGRNTRIGPLHAQPVAARRRLGEHGALAGNSRPPGRCVPAQTSRALFSKRPASPGQDAAGQGAGTTVAG